MAPGASVLPDRPRDALPILAQLTAPRKRRVDVLRPLRSSTAFPRRRSQIRVRCGFTRHGAKKAVRKSRIPASVFMQGRRHQQQVKHALIESRSLMKGEAIASVWRRFANGRAERQSRDRKPPTCAQMAIPPPAPPVLNTRPTVASCSPIQTAASFNALVALAGSCVRPHPHRDRQRSWHRRRTPPPPRPTRRHAAPGFPSDSGRLREARRRRRRRGRAPESARRPAAARPKRPMKIRKIMLRNRCPMPPCTNCIVSGVTMAGSNQPRRRSPPRSTARGSAPFRDCR